MQGIINLKGKKGLVIGIANDKSVAWGCAKAFRNAGAELAVTWLNEKAEPHVRPLAESLDAPIMMPCNLAHEGELEAVFDRIRQEWGSLDFLLHGVAFANKDDLHGRLTDCSREGFLQSMDISCHSFIRMAHLAEPLMTQGGCLLTLSFSGSRRFIRHYNVMGPVKAALEGVAMYLAAELGSKGIRVHALAPGAIPTRAASGLPMFDELLSDLASLSPLKDSATIGDVGALSAFLVSDAARTMTGCCIDVDAGFHIMGTKPE